MGISFRRPNLLVSIFPCEKITRLVCSLGDASRLQTAYLFQTPALLQARLRQPLASSINVMLFQSRRTGLKRFPGRPYLSIAQHNWGQRIPYPIVEESWL